MSGEEHFRRLEHLYRGAACNAYYAPRIHISERVCEIVIPVAEKFFHPGGAVHGSVYFKALDDAAYFAANSLVEDVLLLTVTFNISLLRPVSAGEIRARGEVVHVTHQLLFAEAVAADAEGRQLARGSGTFARSRLDLTPAIGYA